MHLTTFGTMDSVGSPHQNGTLALWFPSWSCNTSQHKWFLVQSNKPQSRGTTGFCPESITFSNLRQRPSNTAPQTKLTVPIRWWYCTMGFQFKHTFCSKTFATGPSKLGNVVCQMENQTESQRNQGDHILLVQTRQTNKPNLKLYGETLKAYPQVKFLEITFDSQLTFKQHFGDILDCCNTRYHRLKLLADKKWGPSPSILIQFINNVPNLFLNTTLFRQLPPLQYHLRNSTAPK